ncbi:MAG: hypothetical protein H7249_02560 [Chitinophagaceae bacterium]|nr:hypothetical protein [Oligoflexus sp.]
MAACIRAFRRSDFFFVIYFIALWIPSVGFVAYFALSPIFPVETPIDPFFVSRSLKIFLFSIGLSQRVIEMRREYKNKLREANSRLEDKVKNRTIELETTNQNLEEQIVIRSLAQDTLKSHQGRMVHRSKIEALGQMSAGVAHEVNNSLMIVMGYAEMVLRLCGKEMIDTARIKTAMRDLVKTCKRIAFTIQSLRNFAVQESPNNQDFKNLKNLLDQALPLRTINLINKGLTVELSEFDPNIFCNFNGQKLIQVFFRTHTKCRSSDGKITSEIFKNKL